jgi:hypothetical protein
MMIQQIIVINLDGISLVKEEKKFVLLLIFFHPWWFFDKIKKKRKKKAANQDYVYRFCFLVFLSFINYISIVRKFLMDCIIAQLFSFVLCKVCKTNNNNNNNKTEENFIFALKVWCEFENLSYTSNSCPFSLLFNWARRSFFVNRITPCWTKTLGRMTLLLSEKDSVLLTCIYSSITYVFIRFNGWFVHAYSISSFKWHFQVTFELVVLFWFSRKHLSTGWKNLYLSF